MQARCFSLKLAFVATFNKGSCPMLLNDVGDGVVEGVDALGIGAEVDEFVGDFPVLIDEHGVFGAGVDLIFLDGRIIGREVADGDVLQFLGESRSVLFDHFAAFFGGEDDDHGFEFLVVVLLHILIEGFGERHDGVFVAVGDPCLNLGSVLVGAWEAGVGSLEGAGDVLGVEWDDVVALVEATAGDGGSDHRHADETTGNN